MNKTYIFYINVFGILISGVVRAGADTSSAMQPETEVAAILVEMSEATVCEVSDLLSRAQRILHESNISMRPQRCRSAQVYICSRCNRSFTGRSMLHKHVQSVHEGITYQCSICDKSFTQRSNLYVHERSVHGSVSYTCATCNKSFLYKSSLREHIKRLHEGIRYQCLLCEKNFANKSHLNVHIKSVHEGLRHVCFCGRKYTEKSNLRRHIQKEHPENSILLAITTKQRGPNRLAL